MTAETLRLDKWLWYARFCKSRSLAADLCNGGRIRVNGSLVRKAHVALRPGDVLTFTVGGAVRVVRVIALGVRRGPAPEAQALYEDVEEPIRIDRRPHRPDGPARERGAGRPTKADRRAVDRLHGVD